MSTPRYDSLKVRLGAAILAMATVAAVVFGVINFQQRVIFSVADDGVLFFRYARPVNGR